MLPLLLLLLWPAAADAAAWRPPVDGPVVAPFTWSPATPYAGGQRRGVLLRTRAGAPVRAACSGRVTFAGPTPRGNAVSVRCGRLTATHLPLRTIATREGRAVVRGTRVGTASRTVLHLGAKRHRTYVDPEDLLQRATSPPLGPTPPAPRATSRRRPAHRAPRAAAPPQRSAPALIPVTGALAVGAAAAAIGCGALVRRRTGSSLTSRPCPTTSTSPRRSTT